MVNSFGTSIALWQKTLYMKRIISALSICVITVLLFSCSAHKVQGVNLNGSWVLNNVNIEGVNNPSDYKITAFNDVSANCLVGSVWFLTQSGNATYTVQQSDSCTGGARPIFWSLSDDNGVKYFQFKHIDNAKARNVTEGYRLELTNVTNSGFTLREPTQLGNNNAYVVYNFSKQ
jgi:hypothetical protein